MVIFKEIKKYPISYIVLAAGLIITIILVIFGVLNAANGEMKELPVVGTISIIK